MHDALCLQMHRDLCTSQVLIRFCWLILELLLCRFCDVVQQLQVQEKLMPWASDPGVQDFRLLPRNPMTNSWQTVSLNFASSVTPCDVCQVYHALFCLQLWHLQNPDFLPVSHSLEGRRALQLYTRSSQGSWLPKKVWLGPGMSRHGCSLVPPLAHAQDYRINIPVASQAPICETY